MLQNIRNYKKKSNYICFLNKKTCTIQPANNIYNWILEYLIVVNYICKGMFLTAVGCIQMMDETVLDEHKSYENFEHILWLCKMINFVKFASQIMKLRRLQIFCAFLHFTCRFLLTRYILFLKKKKKKKKNYLFEDAITLSKYTKQTKTEYKINH